MAQGNMLNSIADWIGEKYTKGLGKQRSKQRNHVHQSAMMQRI